MKIHLLANVFRADAVQAAADAAEWIAGRGVSVAADPDTARSANLESVAIDRFSECDLIVAFGGDGTVMKAAHLAEDRSTPILGVYYGRFGFVTQCTAEQLISVLDQFLAGKSHTENRMMVQAEIVRGSHPIAKLHALNEVILQRAATERMLTVRVAVDGHNLTSYPADGVIVSTPTGSTAYNLSVGGPIFDPRVLAMIVSALAPHTLSARPLVLRPDSTISLTVESDGDSVLSADGQKRLHVLSGDVVRVSQSPRVTTLLTVESDDFLMKLGHRLFWSQSLMGDAL